MRRTPRAHLSRLQASPVTRIESGTAAHVERTTFPYTTRYRVSGEPAKVEAEVERIKRLYPPAGYGTYAMPSRYVSPGTVEVIVDRSNSCE